MKRRVVLLGQPASGKGTQGSFINATGLPDAVITLDEDETVPRECVLLSVMSSQCGEIFGIGQHVSDLGESCPSCGDALTKRADDTVEICSACSAKYDAKTLPLIAYLPARRIRCTMFRALRDPNWFSLKSAPSWRSNDPD